MLPGMELMGCTNLAVPAEVMHHIVRVESSYNPYAIGVVGGRLARQPRNLPEAVATAQMLESRGYNFSLGLAQVNRYNLRKYGLDSYERAFGRCANLSAGASILAECRSRSRGDWGNAFSCYYSGNFVTGYRHGYVQKIFASMSGSRVASAEVVEPIGVVQQEQRRAPTGGTTSSADAVGSESSGRRNPLVALRSGGESVSRSQSVRSVPRAAPSVAAAQDGVGMDQPEMPRESEKAQVSATSSAAARAVPAAAGAAAPQSVEKNEELSDSAFVF